MKTSSMACVLLLVAAVAFIASPAFAEPISTKDSADFNYINVFEGDTVADTSVWTKTIIGTPTYSTDGDVVTWTTTGAQQLTWDGASSAEWGTTDRTLGFTLEFKLKINSQETAGTSYSVSPFVMSASGGSGRVDLFISSTGAVQRQNPGSSLTSNYLTTGDNTDDYHVFRIAREGDVMDGETVVSVGKSYYYRDGVLISDPDGVIGLEHVSPETLLFFGDGSSASTSGHGNYSGSVSIDYFRFDTTGAYAPIPEPSTIALLAAGLIGLLAYAWRKRR